MGCAENPQLYDDQGRLLKNWRSLPHPRGRRLPCETVEAVKRLAAEGYGLWAIHRSLEDQGILVSKSSVWNILNGQWPAQ